MQMLLADIVQYLEAQAIGTRAVNLFYGTMPESPDALTQVYEYPGGANEPNLGKRTTNLVYPKIQVVVRGAPHDYDTPRQKIQDVVTALTLVVNQSIGTSGVLYKAIEAIQDPYWRWQDANFRHKFACNFRITKGYSA